MQDAERLQEQFDPMVGNAQAKADVAGDHHEKVVAQRHAANRELAKFKFLQEVFTLGQNLLNQRKATFLGSEAAPESHILEGLDGALEELGRISRQSQDMIHRFDGSQGALQSLEAAFLEDKTQATARARGLAVSGQRAVDVAASRSGEIEAPVKETGMPAISKAAEEVSGLVEELKQISETEDSAKEPIATP